MGSVLLLGGCDSFMVGATNRRAHDRLLLVGQDSSNWGSRRLQYLAGHFPGVGRFLDEQPAGSRPDMLRSFLDNQGRAGLLLFYLPKNTVYVFLIQERGNPKSMALQAQRVVSERERAEYEQLKRG